MTLQTITIEVNVIHIGLHFGFITSTRAKNR